MKKMYLSLPISGRDLNEVKGRADKIKKGYDSDEYELITPFDVCSDSNLPYSELMGRDVAALLECDAILLDYDWQESKGCRTEKCVAEIYGKPCYKISPDMDVMKISDNEELVLCGNRKQFEVLSDMCDNYSRIICGQLEMGLMPLIDRAIKKHNPDLPREAQFKIKEALRCLVNGIKWVAWYSSPTSAHGVSYDNEADIIYDIHQVIRHFLWQIKPEPKEHCGNSSSTPLRFGSEPLARAYVSKQRK